jgi:cell division protein FtsL
MSRAAGRGGKVGTPWRGVRGPAGQELARFHREPDRHSRRQMGMASLCLALAVVAVLGVVALKVHQVRLSYKLEALRAARVQTQEVNRRLQVEVASLTSPARLETRARVELGMAHPGRGQVLLAREYVAGGTGVGRAEGPRTAAVARPAPVERIR